MLVALRPLEIKQLFDFSIRVYRKRFPALFLSMAMVQLPISLAGVAMILQLVNLATEMQQFANTGQEPGMEWLMENSGFFIMLGVFIISAAFYQLLVMPLGTLTCARLATCALHGETPSFGECLRYSLKRYWPTQVALATYALPLLGLAVLTLVIVVIGQATGSDTAIITGAILGITLIFLGSFVMSLMYFRFFPGLAGIIQSAEELPPGGMGSQGLWLLRRSWELTAGQFWRMLGLLSLAMIAINFISRGITEAIGYIVATIYEVARGVPSEELMTSLFFSEADPVRISISLVIAILVVMIFPPFFQCYQLMLYYDQRCRKEAYDLKLLLGNAELPPVD